ncbi:MAG TPA: hypothetical protein PLA50_16405, partial [Bacteroidia bacterium]|nr:hypothetical protein [Bacteroidia bacterium]
PDDIRDQVELYRHSDVKKLIWAVNYGESTNYPTQVPGAHFLGASGTRADLIPPGGGSNEYVRGQRALRDTLSDFAKQGTSVPEIAAEHSREIGIEFDLMIRLGILGEVSPLTFRPEDNYVRRFPQFRQVMRDGSVAEKASYAFPEVRKLMLDIIEESARLTDADGVNLCFVRGPHFIRYEQPVLDRFRELHGEDAREVPEDDPRLQAVRAEFMTTFLRDARGVLDRVGEGKGKRLNLSIWVWPHDRKVWLGGVPMDDGLDVKGWIEAGLLDSVICQEGVDRSYIDLGAKHGCEFVLFTGYHGELAMSPATVTAAYGNGVDQFAYWDADCFITSVNFWQWARRIGHREEMADWERLSQLNRASTLVKLVKINGTDVENHLATSVYSGG